MSSIWSDSIDPIFAVGHGLESVGVRNWALTRGDALLALQRLRDLGVAVLGGDVYILSDAGVESNCDNWYCDPRAEESAADFLNRSIDRARCYVSDYRSETALFAIVPLISCVASRPTRVDSDRIGGLEALSAR